MHSVICMSDNSNICFGQTIHRIGRLETSCSLIGLEHGSCQLQVYIINYDCSGHC